jgi:hypothetical protein
MSRRSARLLVADMLERIERIERYVSGLDRPAFLGDAKTTDSVVRRSSASNSTRRHRRLRCGSASAQRDLRP